MTNDVVPSPETNGELEVFEPIGVFDEQRFLAVDRVAKVMAGASLIPDGLKGETDQETYANCFLVANQAAGWRMDPFAVAQCVSIIGGKPSYEGKLIAAVLDANLGIELSYFFIGDEKSEDYKVLVSDAPFDDQGKTSSPRVIEGTVKQWQTYEYEKDGKGKRTGGKQVKLIWLQNPKRQLRYRGAREWTRAYKPRVLLGAYGSDEFDEIDRNRRSELARDITPGTNPFMDDKSQQHLQNRSAVTPSPDKKDPAASADRAAGKSDASQSSNTSDKTSGAAKKPAAPLAPQGLYVELNKNLGGARSAESLKKVWDRFLSDNKDSNPNETDKKLAVDIMGLHSKRFSDALDLKDARAAAEDRIAEAFNVPVS